MEEFLEELEEKKEKKRITVLLTLLAILLAILVTIIIFFVRTNQPMAQAKKEATAIAKTSANLETVDKFYWFTRKNTYFTLTGKNDKGTEIVVIVPKSGEKVTVLNQKDGQTEQQITDIVAKAHPDESVMKATLGLYDKRPAWEVVTENDQGVLTYYLMSFDKGEEINVVKDI